MASYERTSLEVSASEAKYPPATVGLSSLHGNDNWDADQPLMAKQFHSSSDKTRNQTQLRDAVLWRIVLIALGIALISLVSTDIWRNMRPSPAVASTPAGLYNYYPQEKTVVLFVHHDTEGADANLRFFLHHALHERADFVFILNGESELRDEIPDHLPNIKVVQRDNSCYDLGAHGEVLNANDQELVKKYDKFILMNASVRGPIMPRWSKDCWTNIFTNRVTDTTKLVGLSFSCASGADSIWIPGLDSHSEGLDTTHKLRHIQAMMLATDKIGVKLLLDPLGLNGCHSDYYTAVATEIRLTSLIWHGGYQVEALMNMWNDQENFEEVCTDVDPYDQYVGGYLPITEVIFSKVRKQPVDVVDKYSHWGRNYSSYDHCPI